MDYKQMSDAELHQLITDAKHVLKNREIEREHSAVIDGTIRDNANLTGRTSGSVWHEPVTVLDTYPVGAEVQCEHGVTHKSQRSANWDNPCTGSSWSNPCQN